MSETTYNLIQAMANGDALETEQAFGTAMAEKLAVKLDDMRTGIAQNMFNQEQQETFVEEDFQWITEEEYLQLTEEEQEEYLNEEQLDELMGKGSLATIKKAHDDASSGRASPVQKFHSTQSARAGHIANKLSTRAKYGKDAQHYHEYGYNSKKAKGLYAKLGKAGKAKVTKTLGKEYTGKDTSPHISTKGKTTIDNPHTKAQQHDSAVDRTKTRSEYGLKQLPQDKETIKGGRD